LDSWSKSQIGDLDAIAFPFRCDGRLAKSDVLSHLGLCPKYDSFNKLRHSREGKNPSSTGGLYFWLLLESREAHQSQSSFFYGVEVQEEPTYSANLVVDSCRVILFLSNGYLIDDVLDVEQISNHVLQERGEDSCVTSEQSLFVNHIGIQVFNCVHAD
jgi:hypothetical protein